MSFIMRSEEGSAMEVNDSVVKGDRKPSRDADTPWTTTLPQDWSEEIRMELNQEKQLAEPSPIVLEIRARMDKLDRVDEILEAVTEMRKAVGQQPLG
jgi:hypothetical protein